MSSSKNLTKHVLKEGIPEGIVKVKKFFHVNPIKNAKSKASKDVNRKARNLQRSITGNDKALINYARNKKAKTTGKLENSKSDRNKAKVIGLLHQRNHQKILKTNTKVIGTGVAIAGTVKGVETLRNHNKVENKVRRKLGLKNR